MGQVKVLAFEFKSHFLLPTGIAQDRQLHNVLDSLGAGFNTDPFASKLHLYPNLQHQEFPSYPPSKYSPVPMLLNFIVRMGTGASNLTRPQAVKWQT